ncbi:hypothetical protein AMJ44_03800 [candidate division WOR-1 bacterium DG_54_3]|uniref:Glycosyl transferase family 1 n=1 Tax=candidate division WOR-1 bacterium DG_54_3 TaxID=1703775 RepID=A0A0S7Y3V5_UNCSA|nr:MAG: hypothetical protein AMJ44_03800 [candidate division WOR-1 bacterium DG_54_3]
MKKRYKIIHIITRLDGGGSAQDTIQTVLGLDKEKYEVILVKGPTYESKMSKEERASVLSDLKEMRLKGVKVVTTNFLIRRINPIYDLLALFSLYKFLIKESPSIVHTHTSKAGIIGRLAAFLSRVPIIVHTPHGHVFFGYFGFIKTKLFIFMERITSHLTDKVIAVTRGEKRDYLLFKIANEDKFIVINSGVKLEKFKELPFQERQNFKKRLGISENALVVGTAGRLVPVKGSEYLIEAAKYIISKFPETYFVFTGDGHLKQVLKRKAAELGIQKNVLFLGWRNDVAKIISIYDIFVLPSLNEGMGKVLVEAMALGRSIVASNVGGIPDLVSHGKNGFLVPPKNPREIARYIQILLEHKEKREEMGLTGKEMTGNFSDEIMVEKIVGLYKELMMQKEF